MSGLSCRPAPASSTPRRSIGRLLREACFDGTVGAASQYWVATAIGANATATTDRSNLFAYVPHIARVRDDVLELPENISGPNVIMQFRFDVESRRLSANSPPRVSQPDLVGLRHHCFHPRPCLFLE